MMQAEIRKERIKKYGSFLWCPERNTLCFGINTPEGSCKYSRCLLDDPAYIAKQAEIDRRIQENARQERLEKAQEKQIIRRQTQTREELLEKEIAYTEAKARRLYRDNKPRAADLLMHKAMKLNAELRKIRGA